MRKILFVVILLLFFLPLDVRAKNTDSVSYFSNKVSIDAKLQQLKQREEKEKKEINDYNTEIETLKKKLAIFGEADELETKKITDERKKLAETIQKKRAKMLNAMLELNKTGEDIAELNASIFEKYVENMKRIDDFVFSKSYLSSAVDGFSRLKVQLSNVFGKNDRKLSFGGVLKVAVSVIIMLFLYRIIMSLREKLDEKLFPWLRFWIKNLTYLLFPVVMFVCSDLFFSFNFVVEGILFAVVAACLCGTFLRKKIENKFILCSLSIVYGCHILFDSMASDFDMKFAPVSVLAACFVIIETVLGFFAVYRYRLLRWIFVIPFCMVMVGYVAVANIVMYRILNVINVAMILTSFSGAVKELLKVSEKFISKYISFSKVKIIAELGVWILSAYMYVIVFAFIIGLRKSQIAEMNYRLFFDLKLYGIDLSITHIALSFAVGFTILGIFSFINRRIADEDIDESVKYSAMVGLKYTGYILAGLIFLTMIGVTFTSISIIVGALSVGIGFGLQNIVNNFVSGVIILFERPIKVGDWVKLSDGQEGKVRNISIRTTIIETFQNAHIIVPNADILSGSFTNWTRKQPYNRLEIPISIALDADPELAAKLLLEVAKKETKVLDKPQPYVIMPDWHDDCIILQLRVYLKSTSDRCMINSNLRFAIVKKFKEYGIERPIPRRSIVDNSGIKPASAEEKNTL